MYFIQWLTDLRCASVSRASFVVRLTIVWARQLDFPAGFSSALKHTY